MKDLNGKVAVITGAGSGLGRALAAACANAEMKLVLADVDETGLAETVALLPAATESLTQHCDVSKPEALDALADATWERFGACHLLFNNAGVAPAGPTWTNTVEDWRWCVDVNLFGVAWGIRSFVPRMLQAGEPGHVVNTASVAGLITPPGTSIYCATKQAVVATSESLHHDLKMVNANIGVSVLCPAFVPTGIADSDRNRPDEYALKNPQAGPFEQMARVAVSKGKVSAQEVANITLDAVRDNRFYILTHPTIKGAIEQRFQHILDEQTPHNAMEKPQ